MFFLKIFILVIGVIEIVSNLYHISKGSIEAIGLSAKRQHQEIPSTYANVNFFIKAIIMFALGITFTIGSIIALYNDEKSVLIIGICSLVLSLYGVIQAIIYRRCISVWGAMFAYSIPLIIFLLVK